MDPNVKAILEKARIEAEGMVQQLALNHQPQVAMVALLMEVASFGASIVAQKREPQEWVLARLDETKTLTIKMVAKASGHLIPSGSIRLQ